MNDDPVLLGTLFCHLAHFWYKAQHRFWLFGKESRVDLEQGHCTVHFLNYPVPSKLAGSSSILCGDRCSHRLLVSQIQESFSFILRLTYCKVLMGPVTIYRQQQSLQFSLCNWPHLFPLSFYPLTMVRLVAAGRALQQLFLLPRIVGKLSQHLFRGQ